MNFLVALFQRVVKLESRGAITPHDFFERYAQLEPHFLSCLVQGHETEMSSTSDTRIFSVLMLLGQLGDCVGFGFHEDRWLRWEGTLFHCLGNRSWHVRGMRCSRFPDQILDPLRCSSRDQQVYDDREKAEYLVESETASTVSQER